MSIAGCSFHADARLNRAILGLLGALCLHGPARAVVLTWTNPSGGLASTPTNWSPPLVPSSTSDLIFSLGNTYPVSYTNAVSSVASHVYRRGAVTLTMNSPHTVSSSFTVGQSGNSTVTLVDGTLRCLGPVTIGDGAATGVLNVEPMVSDGLHARLDLSGAAGVLYVGDEGNGTLNMNWTGVVDADQFIYLGNQPGSTGTVSVRLQAILRTTTAFGGIYVGNSGNGDMEIVDGGQVYSLGYFRVAEDAGSSGIVTVEGQHGQGSPHSTLSVNGDFDLGRNDVAGAAGSGALDVRDDGDVTVLGQTRVGDPNGGSGTLHVEEGGTLTTGSLLFTDGASSLTFDGGTIRVVGGTFDPIGTTLALGGSAVFNTASLDLDNATPLVLSAPVAPFRALEIGSTFGGDLTLDHGSVLVIATGSVFLGEHANGMLEVNSGSSFSTAGSVTAGAGPAGDSGVGQIIIRSGGTATMATLNIASTTSGAGVVYVYNPGSTLTVTSSLAIGGSGNTAGGSARVTLNDAGVVDVNHTGTPTQIWPDGILEVVAGNGAEPRFTSTGSIDLRGTITLGQGRIEVPVIDFLGAASINGHGTVNARIRADDPLAVIAASGGALVLGSASDAQGFVNDGVLQVNAEEVTLNDSDGADLGNVELTGGRLVLPVAGILAAGNTLSGDGEIAGAITNSGAISSTGAGLAFSRILSGTGQGITGTRITFRNGGGFTGSGIIGISIEADSGSTITPTSSLTLGHASAGTELLLDGTLNVGAQTVTLRSLTTIGLGSLTSINGGVLAAASVSLQTDSGDVLAGTGTVAAGIINNGIVDPGSPIGTLTISGGYTQGPGGALAADLGDHVTNAWDWLQVGGAASLNGTLHVRGVPGVTYSLGDVYRIMTFASRSGTFSAVSLENLAGFDVHLVYGGTFVDVVLQPDVTDVVEPEVDLPSEIRFVGRGDSFELSLPRETQGRIEVYDVGGRMVSLLYDGSLPAGVTRYSLGSGARLPSGVYFARFEGRSPSGGRILRKARASLVR